MSKRQQITEHLQHLYTPIGKRDEVKDLLTRLDTMSVKEVTSEQAHKSRLKVLYIEQKGVLPYASYASSGIYNADFGSVGDKFADVCLYDEDGVLYKFVRVGIKTPKIALVEDR